MPEWEQEIRKLLRDARLEPAREAAIVREMAEHLQQSYEELQAEGASEEVARRAILATLGDGSALAAELRKTQPQRSPGAIEADTPKSGSIAVDLLRDLRYATRTLGQNPGFAIFVVLTLGLGIGANTTVFTLLNTLLLNPLPVHDASRLAVVSTVDTHKGPRSGGLLPVSYVNLEDLRAQSRAFTSFAGYTSVMPLTMSTPSGAERVFAELVTANYFETLGITPIKGRFLLPDEGRTPGAHPVAVLGYAMWQTRFGGAADIIGRTLRLNEHVFTIVGVAPQGFRGVNAVFGPDLWIPAMMARETLPAELHNALEERGMPFFLGLARLKPGMTLPQAGADLKTVAAALEKQYPNTNAGQSVALVPIAAAALGEARQPLLFGGVLLFAIVGLVLLIACSNVANLLMARAAGRRQEIAVRLALGAGRGRLIRQLLTESALLGLLSGVCGLAVAVLGCQLLWSFRPAEVARNFVDFRLGTPVYLFALVASLVTSVIFGLAPALQASRAEVVEALKEETRTAGRNRARITFANVLLVGQVAFSLITLITAALFLRGIERAYQIDPGFQTRRLAVLLTNPGQGGYNHTRTEQFYREVRTQVAAMPGIVDVSWASNLPLWGRLASGITIEGRTPRSRSDTITAISNTVDLDYFAVMDIAFTAGRDFAPADRDDALPVAIINQTMAARYWPGQDPIGRRLKLAGDSAYRQIVGVVKTANYQQFNEAPQPCIYVPLRQNYSDAMVLYVRTRRDPSGVLDGLQRTVRAIAPDLEIHDVRTGGKIVDQALWGSKVGGALLGVFGMLALGLASVGLYGILAYTVSRRRHEIGVRMSLGADRSRVLWMILGQGMRLVVMGIAIGLAGALPIGRALGKMLYGLSVADPLSLAGASLMLVLVAALACYLPARRASRVDPLVALREG